MRRQFSVGGVVGDSFSIYLKNFLPFALMALVVHVPLVVWAYLVYKGTFGVGMAPLLITTGLQTLLQFVLTGALVYGVYSYMRGRPAPLGQCISVGLARLLPIIGVALVAGLLTGIGLMLLIVPGVILMCMWWLSVPVAVVEGQGVGAALSRSQALTSGSRWGIFGIILVIGIISGIIGAVVGVVMPATSFSGVLVQMIVSALLAPWGAAAQAVGYHDLRAQKEGIDIERLASAFD